MVSRYNGDVPYRSNAVLERKAQIPMHQQEMTDLEIVKMLQTTQRLLAANQNELPP